MNCNKSEKFMLRWETESEIIKRKLTEFSLQLTPAKFSDMINYKKILMTNIKPEDIELTQTSDGKEIYNLITDSKMKSLCLKYAKETIEKLEYSQKNPDENKKVETLLNLDNFILNLEISNTAYCSNVLIKDNKGLCKIICNDVTISGVCQTSGLSFDVLTFSEGYTHTFVLRFELENGDMYSFYSAIGRDGSKGEKPKVFASALVGGYYVSKEVENTNIY